MGRADDNAYELVKAGGDAGWKLVWENVIVPEVRSLRSADLAKKYCITDGDLMGMLYEEMIGRGKINLFRNDGGSLWGWMRTYVRGYILRAQPDSRLSSLERAGETAGEDGGRGFEEKVSLCLSDWRGRDALPTEDPAVRRREQWELVQKCFADLYRKNPMRAYVHWLKLRMNLSSTEIKSMLGMSSEANVDQTFSRAVKDMRNLKVQHEERD